MVCAVPSDCGCDHLRCPLSVGLLLHIEVPPARQERSMSLKALEIRGTASKQLTVRAGSEGIEVMEQGIYEVTHRTIRSNDRPNDL